MPPVKRRRAWGGRTSAWQDPLDAPMAEIAGSFGPRVARSDVAPVEALAEALALARPRLTVVVVGSNGKTSTATYLSDLFRASGLRTGLFTSPHIAYWAERVLIDGASVDGGALVEAVTAVNDVAQEAYDDRLRFFDVLTLAAACLFADAGVDVAVYEAGIGGRGDATRALRPDLVVLTAIGREHTQLLGDSEEEILRHKLDVAPRGSTVVAGALPPGLAAVARDHAVDIGVKLVGSSLEPPVPGVPWYLAQNWQLARAAAEVGTNGIGCELVASGGPHEIYGRFTAVRRDGVEFLLDVAHNPQAWKAFLEELAKRLDGRRAVAVVSATRERPLNEFVEAITGSALFSTVYATAASVRPTHDTDELAAALRAAGQEAESRPDPSQAFESAAASGMDVAIFGSTFIVTDAMLWLDEPPALA
jgi:dihydrofolate synthase/folylpolyglutamate synthase